MVIQHTAHSETTRAFLVTLAAVGQKCANSANSPDTADSTNGVAFHPLHMRKRQPSRPQDCIREELEVLPGRKATNVTMKETEEP